MILAKGHILADLRELWEVKSFRARVFFAIAPTFLAIAFGALATDRTRPYRFIQESSFVEPAQGRGGTQVVVNWRVELERQHTCPGTVERMLVDPHTGVIVALYQPSLATSIPPSDGWIRNAFVMPQSVRPGLVGYKSKLTYYCNWFQALFPSFAIRYETPVLLFTVEE